MNKLFLIILGIFLISFTYAFDWSTNTIAYWDFNEGTGTNVDDIVGHIHNGTTIGTPVWVNGIMGTGLNISSSAGQYVNASGVGLGFDQPTDSFSLSVWIYLNKTGTTRYIIDKDVSFILYMNTSNYLIFDQARNAGSYTNVWYSKQLITDINTWKHIVVTYNGTGAAGLSIYINGSTTQVNNVAYASEWGNLSGHFTMGSDSTHASGLDGGIDEVALFNKSLSASEVAELYNGGSGLDYLPPTINLIQSIVPDTNYETNTMTNGRFFINVTNNSFISLDANLVYNGTSFTTTKYTGVNNFAFEKNITKTFINDTDISYYWNFTVVNSTGTYYVTYGNANQVIEPTVLALCNSTYPTPYINFTFKDESNLAVLNASIPSSTFVYWMGSDNLINKTLSYTNNSLNYNYTFCLSPNTKNITVDYTLQYASTDYPQRLYNPTALNLTNTSTSQVLYLLGSADGLYVTFQVSNAAGQIITGVSSNATRDIGGTETLVAQGTTDSAGAVTFWLNPDFLHNLYFSKTGYDTLLVSLFPTQTSYTVTLGGQTSTATSDYTRGLSYFFNPGQDFLNEDNKYNFSYTISSTYWALDSFGFSLYWGNNTLIGSNTSTVNTGGTISLLNLNVTNASSVYLTFNFTIEGNTTSRSGRTWIIVLSEGGDFSLTRFFSDLILYIDSTDGLLGFDEFGRILLSLIVIIVVSGGLSYNYGLRSEAAISGIIFGIVFLLDVGLGFIPRISIGGIQATEHFLTIIVFIIMFVSIIKEERQ